MPAKAPERTASQPAGAALEAKPPEAAPPGAEAIAPALEALLISLDKPASVARLAPSVGCDGPGGASVVRDAIDLLNRQYEETGRAFRIEQVAGGFRVMTLPAYSGAVATMHEARASNRLSRAAVETLAVVAYRQPITRAEIEAIRGVACGEVLRTLLERRLVAIAGRAEEVGRPMLYGTSRHFLEAFGLASIKDLPSVGDFAAFARPSPEPGAQTEEEHDAGS